MSLDTILVPVTVVILIIVRVHGIVCVLVILQVRLSSVCVHQQNSS